MLDASYPSSPQDFMAIVWKSFSSCNKQTIWMKNRAFLHLTIFVSRLTHNFIVLRFFLKPRVQKAQSPLTLVYT